MNTKWKEEGKRYRGTRVSGCKAYRKAGKESESVKSKSVDIIEPKATGLKAGRKGEQRKKSRQRKCEGFG